MVPKMQSDSMESKKFPIKNAYAHPKKEIIFENIFCSLFKSCDKIGQY